MDDFPSIFYKWLENIKSSAHFQNGKTETIIYDFNHHYILPFPIFRHVNFLMEVTKPKGKSILWKHSLHVEVWRLKTAKRYFLGTVPWNTVKNHYCLNNLSFSVNQVSLAAINRRLFYPKTICLEERNAPLLSDFQEHEFHYRENFSMLSPWLFRSIGFCIRVDDLMSY